MPQKPQDDDEGNSFTQEYDPHASEAKRLVIYCRLCRRIFPVTFKPRPGARLRCLCGHEAPLSGLDVFENEDRAREFANLYQKLFQAAKQALRDAHLPVPPTGRFDRIRDGEDPPSDIAVVSDSSPEDMSDITSSYVGDGSDERGKASTKEEELRELANTTSDVIEKHDALSELVEHLYCVRHTETGGMDRFRTVCVEDMALAKEVVAEASRRKKAGKKVRITFTSFKHLALALEDDGDFEGAVEVCRAARALGLPGYEERTAKLEAVLAANPPAAKSKLTSKRSRDAWEVAVLPSSGARPALGTPVAAKSAATGAPPTPERIASADRSSEKKKLREKTGADKSSEKKAPVKSGADKSSEKKKLREKSDADKSTEKRARDKLAEKLAPEKPAPEKLAPEKPAPEKPAPEKPAPPRKPPAPPSDEDPIGLLSSSSDGVLPDSADIEDLLPGDDED